MSGSNLRQLCVDVSAELLKFSEWMDESKKTVAECWENVFYDIYP